jgi:hypothetical protein
MDVREASWHLILVAIAANAAAKYAELGIFAV